jgi:hypothetical protein
MDQTVFPKVRGLSEDLWNCRTRPVSPRIPDFGRCEAPSGPRCVYAVRFAGGTLCFHRRWRDFLTADGAA